jgi:hypothetical protein
MIGVCSIGSFEGGLDLVIMMDGYLMKTRIPIKETKEEMVCKPFQHFINERQQKVILLCSLVEFPIVNAHPPSSGGTLGDRFTMLIRNNRHPSLLRHYLNGTNPLTYGTRYMIPACKSFRTSFLTTSLIALLNLLWGSLEGEVVEL